MTNTHTHTYAYSSLSANTTYQRSKPNEKETRREGGGGGCMYIVLPKSIIGHNDSIVTWGSSTINFSFAQPSQKSGGGRKISLPVIYIYKTYRTVARAAPTNALALPAGLPHRQDSRKGRAGGGGGGVLLLAWKRKSHSMTKPLLVPTTSQLFSVPRAIAVRNPSSGWARSAHGS